VGADVGCGNGKYLAVNKRVFIVGSDRYVMSFCIPSFHYTTPTFIFLTRNVTRSTNLVKFAQAHEPHAAVVADNLALPHPRGAFDFAISIAVIHHLSTPERRVEAVRAVLDVVRQPGARGAGTALIYVWALEQKDSRRGWDVMVPWVLKQKKEKKVKQRRRDATDDGRAAESVAGDEKSESGDKTFLRYYHLYKKGELEHDIGEAGGVVLESGYEKDNWWAITSPK
jgi:tRNA (uracil-5-)-methyltransferase TRM9